VTSVKHYQMLEGEINALLASLPTLRDSDRTDVVHFIEVGEFGLALETLVGAFFEDGQKLPDEILPRVRQLVGLMDLTDSPVLRYLRK
jgi:hypothetical protein